MEMHLLAARFYNIQDILKANCRLNARVGGDPCSEGRNSSVGSWISGSAKPGSEGDNPHFNTAHHQWTTGVTIASSTVSGSRSTDDLIGDDGSVGVCTHGVGDDGKLNGHQLRSDGVAGITGST